MTPTLHELETRLAPSASPFPEVPSYEFRLADAPPVWCALAPGGPRVVQGDESYYVADPESRGGVYVGGVRWLLGLRGERIVAESETPAQPHDIDPAANSIDGAGGVLRQTTGLYAVDAGPTPYGVGLVFDSPPTDERDRYDRALLAREVWTALGRWDVFVATGKPISQARGLETYVEVRVSAPYDADAIAADIAERLA